MKKIFLALVVSITFFFAQSGLALAVSCTTNCQNGSVNCSQGQVLQGVGQTGVGCSGHGVTDALSAAVDILSIIAGAAAVIMIVVSGMRYITSGGDSNKVSSAKNALVYALIGVAIAALAQLFVHFVLYNANQVVNPPPPPKHHKKK